MEENVSKALIITGAILLAILIISLGMYIFMSVNGRAMGSAGEFTKEEIQMFNKQFTSYEDQTIYGREVKSLIQKVMSSNEEHIDDWKKVTIEFGSTHYIGNGDTGDTLPNLSKKILENAIYTIKLEFSDEIHLVNNIIIE